MKKNVLFFITIFATLLVIFPTNVAAKINNVSINMSDYILIADEEDDLTLEDLDDWSDDTEEQSCDPNDSILGNPEDKNSVAWLLQQILNYIKILGPILVVLLSSLDFGKVIIQGDDEAMAKAQKKLIYRLILAALLFFIPTIVTALLDIFGLTSDPTCGIK